MIIGFDAKRLFHNNTGLGNYSRNLLRALNQHFSEHQYVLFAEKKSSNYQLSNFDKLIQPSSLVAKSLPAIWRNKWVTKDILKNNVQLFHGLSNELPYGIHNTPVKKVVTVHDIIFEYYPSQYSAVDTKIYRAKTKYACQAADCIIVTSEATKQDLIERYMILPEKIHVVYQSVQDVYYQPITNEQQEQCKAIFQIQKPYLLSVGSIIERKNLLQVCKAISTLKDDSFELWVVGSGGKYFQQVKQFIKDHQLSNQIRFLNETFKHVDIQTHLPALYQMSRGLVYMSIKEGFGIPIVEAYASGVPVLTSSVSSMKEIGENYAITVPPDDINAIASNMQQLIYNDDFFDSFKNSAQAGALKFSAYEFARATMDIYNKLL
jgi:Glycosyltransferase